MRSCWSFGASFGGGAFFSAFFLGLRVRGRPLERRRRDQHGASHQPDGNGSKMRSLCKVSLRSLRIVRHGCTEFPVLGHSAARIPTGATAFVTASALPHTRFAVTSRAQPWLALQMPAQAPVVPWPRQVPLPRPSASRPDPLALWPPLETLTLTCAGGDDASRDADRAAAHIVDGAAADHDADSGRTGRRRRSW